ncbi:MAG: DnaA/Hda family protein [Desulfovibrionaceae bacterium]
MPKEQIKKKLQLTYPSELLQRWYDPLILDFNSETHILQVRFPHAYFESWFQHEGRSAFEQAFADWQHTHMPEAHLQYCSFSPKKTQVLYGLGIPPQDEPSKKISALTEHAPNTDFDSFITNSKNAFPLAAAREVANPHSSHNYNPFVICGKNGTGKTHILRAIVAERNKNIQKEPPDKLFFGCVDTLEELFCTHTTASLLAQYNCFVVDDIQGLAHRPTLQEQIVKILDASVDHTPTEPTRSPSGAQLVFACTGTLTDQEGLSEALRSRLEVGLVVELKAADIDVRMRFAQKRCASCNIKAERSQMLLLAQRCTNLRQLSGIILKIQAFHDLVQRDITISDLENILRNIGDNRQTQPADIVATVGQYTGHKVEDILGSKRKPDLVLARQTAMYLCRELLGTSYPVLGRFFGGKDHSTVIHSIQKIKKLLVSNKDTQTMVTELQQKCQGR